MRVSVTGIKVPFGRQVEPVGAVVSRRDRGPGGPRRPSRRSASGAAARFALEFPTVQPAPAELVAQAVFHQAFAGRSEPSVVHAVRVYRRADELKLNDDRRLSGVV